MSDDASKDGKPAFTVTDRRKRYDADAEPAREPDRAPAAEPDAEAPAPEPPAAKAAEQPGPEEAPHAGAAPGHPGEGGAIGPADFVQLVGKLYEEALVFMGYHDDPGGGQSMRNLPVASWHIDALELLKAKTKGNLTDEEAKLLGDAVANLKVLFVRASGYIKH